MAKAHKIFVFGKINDEMSKNVCQDIAKIALIAKDDDCVVMIINSLGGIALCAYEIIHALHNLNLSIITIGHQKVASAATLLLAAGQTRLATAGTEIIHHRVKIECNIYEGLYTADNIISITTTLLDEVKKIIAEEEKIFTLATHDSLLSAKKLSKMLAEIGDKNLVFETDTAKKIKLIHDILPSLRALPNYLREIK